MLLSSLFFRFALSAKFKLSLPVLFASREGRRPEQKNEDDSSHQHDRFHNAPKNEVLIFMAKASTKEASTAPPQLPRPPMMHTARA